MSNDASSSASGSASPPPAPILIDMSGYVTPTDAHGHMACLTCRSRKTRCDGVRPRCGHCTRLNKECVFAIKIRKPRRPRTELLEEKLRDLESKIHNFSSPPRSRDPRIREKLLSHRLFLQAKGEIQLPNRFIPPLLPYFPHAIWANLDDEMHFDTGEGYSTVIRREIVEAAMANWNQSQPLPLHISEHLIRMFLPYRAHFMFQINLPRFVHDLRRQPGDPKRIHPGLLNVIYCFACKQAGGYLAPLASYFLAEARRTLEEALSMADRLQHWLWGNLLLGFYLAREARPLEAYSVTSSLVRFAVGCGLHHAAKRDTPEEFGVENDGLLPPPDNVELEERIFLWYAIYLCDRILAQLVRMHSSVPPECIPRIDPFESQGAVDSMGGTTPLSDLEPKLMPAAEVRLTEARDFDVSKDIDVTLGLKMNVLQEAILALGLTAKDTGTRTASFMKTFNMIESSIAEMQRTLPPLDSRAGLTANEKIHPITPVLFWTQGVIYSCSILLYSIPLLEDDSLLYTPSDATYKHSAYTKRLKAALDMASLIQQVNKGGGRGLRPIHGGIHTISHIFAAAEVLARELPRDYTSNAGGELELQQNLEGLFDFIADITSFHDPWLFQSHMKRIQNLSEVISAGPGGRSTLAAVTT